MVYRILCSNAAFRKRLTSNFTNLVKDSKRFGGGADEYVGYREPAYYQWFALEKKLAVGVGVLMWSTILYGFYDTPGHVFGEWPEPDLSSYTNEELGIPPDDAGLAPVIPNVRSTVIKRGPPMTLNKDPYRLELMYGDTGVYKF